MTDFYQYQIEVNGDRRNREDALEAWRAIAQTIDARGGNAKLYRRFVTDQSFVENFHAGVMPEGYCKIGDHIVGSWEVFAEVIS